MAEEGERKEGYGRKRILTVGAWLAGVLAVIMVLATALGGSAAGFNGGATRTTGSAGLTADAFTATITCSCVQGLSISTSSTTISVSGSASGGTTPYSYSWDWGDGSSPSTGQYPSSHTYVMTGNSGSWTITLTVTDNGQHQAQATQPVYLKGSGLFITHSKYWYTLGATVYSSNSLTIQALATTNDSYASLEWNMGDGTYFYTAGINYQFGTGGTHTVQLNTVESGIVVNTITFTVGP